MKLDLQPIVSFLAQTDTHILRAARDWWCTQARRPYHGDNPETPHRTPRTSHENNPHRAPHFSNRMGLLIQILCWIQEGCGTRQFQTCQLTQTARQAMDLQTLRRVPKSYDQRLLQIMRVSLAHQKCEKWRSRASHKDAQNYSKSCQAESARPQGKGESNKGCYLCSQQHPRHGKTR